MMKTKTTNENRRNFLKTLIPAGTVLCLGCPTVFSMKAKNDLFQEQDFDSKIKNEFSISWEQYFKNRFNGTISWMKTFAEHYGKDEVINIIKEQSDKWNYESEPNLEAKSVKDYILPGMESDMMKNSLDFEYVELTDKVCEVKIHHCLWAKTFRDKDAGDFGYACICHGDFSYAQAFNPKLRLERTMTLMQGHDCCNHRWIWEG
jgi:hypothetical protein